MLDFELQSKDYALAIAGFFGALISLGRQALNNWKTTIVSLVTGMSSAHYLTPVLVDDTRYQNATAFILGFIGLKGVERVAAMLQQTKP